MIHQQQSLPNDFTLKESLVQEVEIPTSFKAAEFKSVQQSNSPNTGGSRIISSLLRNSLAEARDEPNLDG